MDRPEKQKRGRNKREKRLVALALEKVKDEVGRAYDWTIETVSVIDYVPFFNNFIDNKASVITDECWAIVH